VIETLLPAQVAYAELFGDVACPLFPEEERVVARVVDKRRREFVTVRHCARLALADLGYAPVPIMPGERGCPRWPRGVVGSLTHCDGYRAAVVSRAGPLHAIGIDAEPHGELPPGVADLVVRPEERAMLAELAAADSSVCWDKLLFSAKESVYKAWFPLARRWLDFLEATLTVKPDGEFQARLLVEGPTVDGRPLGSLAGRWLVDRGLVVTAATVPRAPADSGAR
jgi:4'-phosphopantetheinyl transferase EntD